MTRHTFVRRRVFSVCEEVALGQRSSSEAALDAVGFFVFFSADSGAKCNTKQWSESRVRLSRLSQTAPGSSGTRAEHFSREILRCYTQTSFEKIQQGGNVVFFFFWSEQLKSHITRSHSIMSSNYLLVRFSFFSAFFVILTPFLNFSLLFFNLIALISHTCLVFPSLPPLSSSAAPVFNCPAHPSVF